MLKTKSVHSPIGASDGLRILATRYRGRGLSKTRYHVWMANLGPSETLLRSLPTIGWTEFARAYRAEIFADAGTGNRTIKNHGQKFTLRLVALLARRQQVTLLCHCAEEEAHCHRHLLHRLIERSQ
jgi:uncharacterized protein YeaO (DUF488 family)